MRVLVPIGALLVCAFLLVGADTSAPSRPASWAQPLTVSGVPNLHKVSDTLYRSAQPTEEGLRALRAMGIRTSVSLRWMHSDQDEAEGSGLRTVHISMPAWHPEFDDAVRFLKIVTDPQQTPVLVHCLHGADRTGAMVVLYRVAVQGWTKAEALREMTEGGFGFHEVWVNLKPWIERLDVERLRREAGLTPAAPAGK
jgi:protein tyrosine phosphatase (PTP) superfamily phosphohydrolase (DUF442 family)